MKIKIEDKTIVRRYITIGDASMELDEFTELLGELASCDGFVERLVIYNDTMAKELVKAGIAAKNARGSYGYKSKKKLNTLRSKLFKMDEETNIDEWKKGKIVGL